MLTQYNAERDNITYQNSRASVWTGKVGLIYASDFGYASTDLDCHNNLRAGLTYDNVTDKWNYTNTKCKTDNWLAKNSWYWTISSFSNNNYFNYNIGGEGFVNHSNANSSLDIFPSVYLKSNIKITSGTGEKDSSYKLN